MCGFSFCVIFEMQDEAGIMHEIAEKSGKMNEVLLS